MMESLAAAVEESSEKVTVTLLDAEGKEIKLEGILPSSDQVVMFMAAASGDTMRRLGAVMDLMEDMLGDQISADLKRRVRDRQDPLTFEDIAEALVEAVTDFPTRAPSASSSTRTRTGGRSTGRVRSQASTPSA